MKALAFLFKQSSFPVVLAILTGLVAGASNVGLIALINTVLNRQTYAGTGLLWGFIALAALLLVSRISSSLTLSYLSQRATLDLRLRLTRQVLATPLRHLEEIGAHRIYATLTNDVATITGGLLIIPTFCLQAAMLVGSLIYLAWLSWRVFVAVFLVIVIGMVTYQIGLGRAMRHQHLSRELQDTLFAHFRSMTEGAQELKLHRRRRISFLRDLVEPAVAKLRRQNLASSAIFVIAGSWGQGLFYTLIGLLLFALPAFSPVDSTILIGYTLTILYVAVPIESISSMIPGLTSASIALKKVESLGLTLTSEPPESAAQESDVAVSPWQSLALVGVTHRYYREQEGATFTLGPIDLVCRPGELIFLIGGNGSGKTTLAKLLCGLYVPEAGEVRLNGLPITDQTREYYRQHFSTVFSNFYLFDNLLGLEAPMLEARAERYLIQLQLEKKVQIQDGRLSTLELSQGQRKRLALLTAYLEDRPIYIFDEWAADQDPGFKEVFYLQILPEMKRRGKTVFVISHDDRYYSLADRLIKLTDGQLEYDSAPAEGNAQREAAVEPLRVAEVLLPKESSLQAIGYQPETQVAES